MMFLTRGYEMDLTVRGDGRTVYGYAVPFNVEALCNDGFGVYAERFVRGAFRNVVKAPHHVKFQYQHEDDVMAWVGNAVLLREEDRGLYGEWKLDATERGRQVAYKIHDGQLPGLSIGFYPAREDRDINADGLQRITRKLVKRLEHVAAVQHPAYAPVEALAVREKPREESSVERWRAWRASVMVDGDGRT